MKNVENVLEDTNRILMGNSSNDKNDELSITEQINQLYRELATAQISYEMYKNVALKSSEISIDLFNKFSEQFPNLIKAERAIFSSMLFIQFYKLLDTHPKSISIQNLLKMCKDSPEFTKHEKDFHNLLTKYRKPIKKLRHQIFAHTDSSDSPDNIFKSINPTISYGDLKNALSSLKEVIDFLNKILSSAINNSPPIDYNEVGREQKKVIHLVAQNIGKKIL